MDADQAYEGGAVKVVAGRVVVVTGWSFPDSQSFVTAFILCVISADSTSAACSINVPVFVTEQVIFSVLCLSPHLGELLVIPKIKSKRIHRCTARRKIRRGSGVCQIEVSLSQIMTFISQSNRWRVRRATAISHAWIL
jgi:hypothetical protein